jgi:glycosyltransferase involved in cell wall biosynthesis
MATAAILSVSPTRSDPRILRQISWLIEAGYFVENHGLGEYLIPQRGQHYRITETKIWHRLGEYLENRPFKRAANLLNRLGDKAFIENLAAGKFTFVILNDLEFIGVPEIEVAANTSKTPIIIDLHEFFPDTGDGLIWQFLHGRYYKFLLEKLPKYNAFKMVTVSEEIAGLYHGEFGISCSVIMNIPEFEGSHEGIIKPAKDSTVKLIHHGIWNPRRGILRLIRAMNFVEGNKTLTLMLVASPNVLAMLRAYIWILGLGKRVTIAAPSVFKEIVPTLQNFDFEVIFYHPPHSKNEYYSLPNKFFEAIAAGLALVVGPSPSMAKIVKDYNIGLVVENWSRKELAKTLNAINHEKLRDFRGNLQNSNGAFSINEMKRRFLEICDSARQEGSKARMVEK